MKFCDLQCAICDMFCILCFIYQSKSKICAMFSWLCLVLLLYLECVRLSMYVCMFVRLVTNVNANSNANANAKATLAQLRDCKNRTRVRRVAWYVRTDAGRCNALDWTLTSRRPFQIYQYEYYFTMDCVDFFLVRYWFILYWNSFFSINNIYKY